MNAKEMFEKLGYNQELDGNEYIKYAKGSELDQEIMFNLSDKHYLCMDYITALTISIELHKAITRQLKELGWLDD
jgi:hypothetical protein